MPSDFHQQQQPTSVSDTKTSTASQPLTSDEIKAGTKVVMTHAERQAFVKTSRLGQVFGVAHLLPEVGEVAKENQEVRAIAGKVPKS